MEHYTLPEHLIMDFEIYDTRIIPEHFHRDLEILCVLEGDLTLKVGNHSFPLQKDDFVLINSNVRHSCSAQGDILLGAFMISYQGLLPYVDMSKYAFDCNSVTDKAHVGYSDLRGLLRSAFNEYFDKSGELGRPYVLLSSIYFKILDTLMTYFMYRVDDTRFTGNRTSESKRIREIVDYINNNYRSPITLNSIADQMFFSTAYLSKYIKSKLGTNFVDYLNSVRLRHAVDDMNRSGKSILRLALDNGFPNVASFNKTFKEAYGLSPSVYREKTSRISVTETTAPDSIPRMGTHVSNRLKQYLQAQEEADPRQEAADAVTFVADTRVQHAYKKSWSRMVNMGMLSDLLSSDIQEHTLFLVKNLGYTHIRFWDIYSDELMLNIRSGTGNYNFGKMDRAMDFLVENHIHPYIELGFKPKILISNVEHYMISEERPILFKSNAEESRFLTAMLSHFANRYGIDEIETWYFEQWNDPRLLLSEDFHEFFEVFETAYHVIKSVSPRIRLGGGIDQPRDLELFTKLTALWKRRHCCPDFISIYCYPYLGKEAKKAVHLTNNPNVMRDFILGVKNVMNEHGFSVSELHISEWNLSVSNRNYLNDSCFKGAYVMKNIIDNWREVDLMGYWIGSDLFSEFTDTSRLLNGGGGLISRDGIRKPAYCAMDFLNQMGRYYIGSNENCMITTSGRDSYSIACHNYKHPNIQYYMKREDDIDIRKIHQFFDDLRPLKISFRIRNVRNGTYQMKIRSINTRYGSVQNEWLRMGLSDNLNSQDVDYLRNICTPHITIQNCTVTDNTLIFDTILEAQEIQYIHLIFLL